MQPIRSLRQSPWRGPAWPGNDKAEPAPTDSAAERRSPHSFPSRSAGARKGIAKGVRVASAHDVYDHFAFEPFQLTRR